MGMMRREEHYVGRRTMEMEVQGEERKKREGAISERRDCRARKCMTETYIVKYRHHIKVGLRRSYEPVSLLTNRHHVIDAIEVETATSVFLHRGHNSLLCHCHQYPAHTTHNVSSASENLTW